MSRICPKCMSKLGGYDSFFCTSCGEALPQDLINRDGVFSRIANFATSSKEKNDRNNKPKIDFKPFTERLKVFVNIKSIAISILCALFIIGTYFFVQNRIAQSIDSPSNASETLFVPEKFTKNIVEVPLDWETNTFGIDNIMEFVPFNADIVIEGNDLLKFGNAYFGFDPIYKDLFTFLNGKVDQHFVFFAKEINGEYAWSLIYFPLKKQFNISDDLVTKYSWLKFWKNDPIALITTQASILSEVSDTKGKIIKNFTQTTIYATSRSTSPKNGKLFVYATSAKAKNYIKTLGMSSKLSKDIQKVVESVGKENSDYSIIL